IHLPGYTAYEKHHIAVDHLIPRIKKELSLDDYYSVTLSSDAITAIISQYTREAGVRNLDRNISKILRKTARDYVSGQIKSKVKITPANLTKYLGIPRHLYPEMSVADSIGVVTGLAWTMSGGEILEIEVLKMKGEGKLNITGQIGNVMKESAQAALSYARGNAEKLRFNPDEIKTFDLHLHVPEGAIPKDGPSAGVTILTGIVSVLTNKKVRCDLAMTGEITLTGKVLPIGGLEEKLIAAKRAGIKDVLIPAQNEPKLTEINTEILKGLNIITVKTVDEVLKLALVEE
ncbi:MAG: magnesium chelatase domain-containing protein, partial [Candidatus Cloacimonetes bacterium]|nr:magnesium chelatase domain-containing protein [Candidatus Cloacimonadota bacterium]